MSRDVTAAKRYAKALYEVASEHKAIDETIAEMKQVAAILLDHEELQAILKHPTIEASAKTKILSGIFEGKISTIVLHSLFLLVENKRSDLISTVYEEMVKIAGAALGRAEAIVYSPKALSEEEAASVAATFSSLTGKSIQVTNIVDDSLLGGITVRIGDTFYDGSLSGKLKRMAKALQASQAL